MKKVFILNPNTRQKEQYRLMKEIKKHFQGQTIILEKTKTGQHARMIAKKYALMDDDVHIFVCGGDGTIHDVINGIVGHDNITLTPIPIGRGNDFVKSFQGLEREGFLNFDHYKNPSILECDLLKVDGQYAMNTVSFGFDVQIAQYVNDFRKVLKGTGTIPYYLGMLASLIKMKPETYSLHLDQKKLPEKEYMFVVFCNGKYYGGGYQPCPQAQLNDGWMDICLIKPIPRYKIIQLAKSYEKGQHVAFEKLVQIEKGKVVHYDTKNKTVLANLDGEIYPVKNPTVEIVEKAIRLALPKKMGD